MKGSCSVQKFRIPKKNYLHFAAARLYKLVVNSFYGEGPGLRYLNLIGTMAGGIIHELEIINYIC